MTTTVRITFNGIRPNEEGDDVDYIEKKWAFELSEEAAKDIVDMVRILVCVHPEEQCGEDYATIEVDGIPAHEHELTS